MALLIDDDQLEDSGSSRLPCGLTFYRFSKVREAIELAHGGNYLPNGWSVELVAVDRLLDEELEPVLETLKDLKERETFPDELYPERVAALTCRIVSTIERLPLGERCGAAYAVLLLAMSDHSYQFVPAHQRLILVPKPTLFQDQAGLVSALRMAYSKVPSEAVSIPATPINTAASAPP